MASGSFVPHGPMFTPSTPSSSSASDPPFDFSLPDIPNFKPRLSKVGRQLSNLGSQIFELEPSLSSSGGNGSGEGGQNGRRSRQEEVPGMGEEPVMCPFCEKPLPPSIFEKLVSHSHTEKRGTSTNMVRGFTASTPGTTNRKASAPSTPGTSRQSSLSVAMASSASAGPGVPHAPQGSGLSMTAAAPGNKPTQEPEAMTMPTPEEAAAASRSIDAGLKVAETADMSGAAAIISEEELARWSKIAGISLPEGSTQQKGVTSAIAATPSAQAPAPVPAAAPPQMAAPPAKAFPSLAPPPPPASKVRRTNESVSGFGFFKRGGSSKANDDLDEEDSDDDDMGAGSGYAKLMAPGSPDREDVELPDIEAKRKAKQASETAPVAEPATETTETAAKTIPPDEVTSEPAEPSAASQPPETPARTSVSDDEIKKTLAEVVSKVDQMSKSHSELLSSHATVLTLLKIAKSNLAMAEANSEMLEADLKRVRSEAATRAATPAVQPMMIVPTAPSPQVSPVAPTRGISPIPVPSGPVSRVATPANDPASLDAEANALVAAAVKTSPQPEESSRSRSSLELLKPIPIPGIKLSPGRRSEEKSRPTSLQIPAPSPLNTGPTTAPTETKGWGFWQGGKKKLPGGLGSFTIPSPAQVAAALDGTLPPTPVREGEGYYFQQDHQRSVTTPMTRPGTSGGLQRSNTLHAGASGSGSAPRTGLQGNPQQAEMVKLRQASALAQQRMDAMAKELAELKKGKVEMEAELENLSQALFEEANKMVADERKRRAETEEALKEVKEEREALKQTIKVLGGSVKEPSEGTGSPTSEGDLPDEFMPRDLDKHYEALRKTIHHVADGAETTPEQAFDEAVGGGAEDPSGQRERSSMESSFRADYSMVPEDDDTPMGGPRAAEDVFAASGRPSLRRRSLTAPLSPNPWADADPVVPVPPTNALGLQPPEIEVTASTPAAEKDASQAGLQREGVGLGIRAEPKDGSD